MSLGASYESTSPTTSADRAMVALTDALALPRRPD